MEKPTINLTIGSLINQYVVINLPFDGQNHSDEHHKRSNLFPNQELESSLSKLVSVLNNALESSDKDCPETPQDKKPHQ